MKDHENGDHPSRPYDFKFFKGSLPQILLGPFLNTLIQIFQRVILSGAANHTKGEVKIIIIYIIFILNIIFILVVELKLRIIYYIRIRLYFCNFSNSFVKNFFKSFILWLIVRKGVSAPRSFFIPPSWYPSLSLEKCNSPPSWHVSWENTRFCDDTLESERFKTINIKSWKPITYRNCLS